MSQVRKLAEEIFRKDHPIDPCPYGGYPTLDKLWPKVREKYMRRAEDEIVRRAIMAGHGGDLQKMQTTQGSE